MVNEDEHGKLNLIGLWSTLARMESIPTAGVVIFSLRIQLVVGGETHDVIPWTTIAEVEGANGTPVFIAVPFDVPIATGQLTFEITADEPPVVERSYLVKLGAAPLLGRPSTIPLSTILGKGKSVKLEDALVGATSKLVVVDAYLPPRELHNILRTVASTTAVRVVTSAFGAKPQTPVGYEDALNALPPLNLRNWKFASRRTFMTGLSSSTMSYSITVVIH